VREGKTRIQAALVGARELVGPTLAMTITLAAVYTPIGFQGGLTGSLFLEFAITLAAAVVVSGIVAITLSPVMSSRFVHDAGKEGKLARQVQRGFEAVRRRYERLLEGALQMRWAIVAGAVVVMIAAVPLYQYSRRELAPVEDQSHISLFMQAAPDASLEATNRASLEVVKAIRSFPEARFMWSLTASWGGFGGMVMKNFKERTRTTEQMYGQVYGAVSQIPGLQVFPRLDPPLPTPGQYDVELVLASDLPPEQMLQTVGTVLGAGWQSGQLVPVSTFTHIESTTAPRTLNRFQQRNAVRIFGGVKPGVTKEEGLRVLENAARAAAGPAIGIDYAGESRQMRLEGAALSM